MSSDDKIDAKIINFKPKLWKYMKKSVNNESYTVINPPISNFFFKNFFFQEIFF